MNELKRKHIRLVKERRLIRRATTRIRDLDLIPGVTRREWQFSVALILDKLLEELRA